VPLAGCGFIKADTGQSKRSVKVVRVCRLRAPSRRGQQIDVHHVNNTDKVIAFRKTLDSPF